MASFADGEADGRPSEVEATSDLSSLRAACFGQEATPDNANTLPCVGRWRGGVLEWGQSGAARDRGEWGRTCPNPQSPGGNLRSLRHRALDHIGSAVVGSETGFGRQVRIALGHQRIAVAEHLLNDAPGLGHVGRPRRASYRATGAGSSPLRPVCLLRFCKWSCTLCRSRD